MERPGKEREPGILTVPSRQLPEVQVQGLGLRKYIVLRAGGTEDMHVGRGSP